MMPCNLRIIVPSTLAISAQGTTAKLGARRDRVLKLLIPNIAGCHDGRSCEGHAYGAQPITHARTLSH